MRLARFLPCVLIAGCAVAAPAGALPGDPPITPLAPAEGAVVPANLDGVTVTFACPPYREAIFAVGDQQLVDAGVSPDDYDVVFAPTPAVDDGGVLISGFSSATRILAVGDGSCAALLDTPDSATSPEQVGGRVVWLQPRMASGPPGNGNCSAFAARIAYQQAIRSCLGGGRNQQETVPVRSFTIRAPAFPTTVRLPPRVYAGYLTRIEVRGDGEVGGAQVELQRRVGASWRRVATADYASTTSSTPRCRPGASDCARWSTTADSQTASPVRTVTVRPDTDRQTSARDDGSYRGRRDVRLQVTGGGRTLRAFRTPSPGSASVAPSRTIGS